MNNEQLEQQQETFMIKYHAYLQLEKDLAEVEQVKPANQVVLSFIRFPFFIFLFTMRERFIDRFQLVQSLLLPFF